MSKGRNLQTVHRRSTHLDSGLFGFLYNLNEIRLSGVLELVSCDRSAAMFINFCCRSCRDYQSMKERNYDDFYQLVYLIDR